VLNDMKARADRDRPQTHRILDANAAQGGSELTRRRRSRARRSFDKGLRPCRINVVYRGVLRAGRLGPRPSHHSARLKEERYDDIITSICLRDGGCVEVCPVECIVPGNPSDEWPLYYIDPDTCIDCGACVPECPWEAIFPEEDVPSAYVAKGSINVRGQNLPQRLNMRRAPLATRTCTMGPTATTSSPPRGTKILKAGEVVDLTPRPRRITATSRMAPVPLMPGSPDS